MYQIRGSTVWLGDQQRLEHLQELYQLLHIVPSTSLIAWPIESKNVLGTNATLLKKMKTVGVPKIGALIGRL